MAPEIRCVSPVHASVYPQRSLACTGVTDTGRGVTLSRVGDETLIRSRSFHLRSGD